MAPAMGPSPADALDHPREGTPRLVALSDEEVMRRVQATGDAQAFGLLMRRWARPVERLCARMTGDVHRAEDLAQEAFTRVYAQRQQYRGEARFSTFLWRIALNLCQDEKRRSARRHEVSPDMRDDEEGVPAGALRARSTPLPEAVAAEHERAERVRQAVIRLSEHYRAVVVLRHYEGLKFREIAEVLDLPEGTVKSRMAEALTRLAKVLAPWAPD